MLDAAHQKPLIIAHRGFRARYPENTLSAFRASKDAGADMIELDVTLTRDRHVVVIHDATLDRTTNGKGPVADFTLEELRRLDAGGWFADGFSGERLPTLDEVLDLDHRPELINIEIKPEAYESGTPPDAIERQVVEAVVRRGLTDRALISSFDWRILQSVSRLPSPPAIGLLRNGSLPSDGIDICRTLGAFSWHCHHLALDRSQVDQLHDAGLKVFPYTVNSRRGMMKLVGFGVDGIFTDNPSLMREVIQSPPPLV